MRELEDMEDPGPSGSGLMVGANVDVGGSSSETESSPVRTYVRACVRGMQRVK